VFLIGRRLVLNKPNSFIESYGRRILWIVLSSAFLLVVGLSQVAPSQENGAERDKIVRQIVQNYIRIGTEQYVKGYFDEAENTFLMAEGYQQFLTAAERQQLEDLLEKTRAAVSERKQIVETYQTVIKLLAQDELVKAKAYLEKIKNSKFLTKQEGEQIAEALRRIDSEIRMAGPVLEKGVEEREPVAEGPDVVIPNVEEGKVERKVAPANKGAVEEQKRIAELYYSSMKLYRAGELEKAREGFIEVIESGLIPAAMTKTLEGYVERIDKTPAEKAGPATRLAGKPSAGKEGADRRKQTAELYKQSVELYYKGDLEKAHEGFIRVAQSGLLTAAGEKNVSDYLQRIEKLQGGRATAEAVTELEEAVPEIGKPQPPALETGQEQEGAYIDVINRRRNLVRGHARAVVNDAIAKARSYMEKGEFDKAKEVAANAEVTVTTNQMHLGEELFKQYISTLTSLREQIVKAENEKAQKDEEEKRTAAASAQRKFREQMEVDRGKRKAELMKNARAYQQEQRYEAALGQLESLLALDPQNQDALVLKQTLEDMIYFKKQLEVQKEGDKQRTDILLKTDESGIPYAEELTYPKNWREITQKPTRRPDEPIGLDPADVAVYEQLDKIVDLSQLTPQMPLSEAIEVIKNSVEPALRIVVLWRDLQENAQVNRSMQINMDGLPAVRLAAALENLLKAVSGAFAQLGFVVENGVITIATVQSLPSKLETRVYDITDLLGQPANFMAMPGQTLSGMYGGGGYGGGGGMGGMGGGMYGGGGYGGGGGGYGGGGYGGMGGGGYGGGGGGYGGGGYGGGGYGGGGMGGYGGGGMGGYGGGGMGGYGGGGMGGGMYGGGMGGGMYGGGGMGMNIMGAYRAEDLVTLIEETIQPDTWYDISTTGQGSITPYPRDQPKKLAVLQTREVHKKIEKLLAEMRRALGYQVAIEARFLVVSENFLEDIGLDVDFLYTGLGGKWGELRFQQGSALTSQPDTSTKVPGSLGGISPAGMITGGYGSILDDLQVAFLLRATQAHTDAKSLTEPKVTVLSGETASFWVLNDVSYVLPPDISTGGAAGAYPGGGYTTSSIQQRIGRLQVGSTLQITPIITPDKKNVLLNIITELNDLLRMRTHTVEAVNAAGQVATYSVTVPETETSQVMTRVSVPDGGTLLLGGQKITAEVEKEVGVPVLSKIPVLGRLFGNRSKIKDEKILLILVKPTIILQEEREAEATAAMESGS